MNVADPVRSLRLPGVLLGVGLGGFVDGILLHQVLQWHHLLSSTGTDNLGLPPYPVTTVEGLRVNTLWDGLFHSVTWIAVAAGLGLLWRAWQGLDGPPPPGRLLVGLLAIGWGLFNVVEGVVNHHLLAIHHVRAGPDQLLFDLGFLAFGVALLGGGWALVRSASPARA